MVFRVFGRLIGRFFKAIGRLLLNVLRTIARHEAALGIVVLIVLLVGGIWLLLTVLDVNIVLGQPQTVVAATPISAAQPTPVPSATSTPSTAQISLSNAPASTETFLQGQVYFDADKVWNSLDASLHTALQGQGEDQKYFAQVLDDLKSKGRQYLGYKFMGTYTSTDKQLICFYVISYQENNQVIEQPYTFWLDNEGKITKFQQGD